MKRYVYGIPLMVVLIVVFLVGSWYGHRSGNRDNPIEGRRLLYYVDPMNPSHTSDKPGIAPCGMKMEPVYTDEGVPSGPAITPGTYPLGTVRISPDKQQIIGIRTGQVEKTPTNQALRTTGRVVADETRTYRLNAAVDGWIVKAPPFRVGSLVKKNEKLGSFYAPEFIGPEQAYIYALSALDRFQATGKETATQLDLTSNNIRQYRDSLRNLGMGDAQIEEIARTRQYSEEIDITSPSAGFILLRNITPGERIDKGKELFRIADLSKVWVAADLFGKESEYVKPGMKVRIRVPHQTKIYETTVSQVLPQFDPNSRTLKVGMEVDNPGYSLRPDMFVDVEFPITMPATLSVPSEAVLDSGIKKTVFVDRGNGFFEPRTVETGWRLGERTEITKGLMAGERIVVSGNFLIDSESRMKQAAAGMQASPASPTAGTK
jgi:membrane fusion protein, copper/silver efflux system